MSTYGIIFLGTPHTGPDAEKWGNILQGMVDTIIPQQLLDTEPHLIRTLLANKDTLQNINVHFLDIYQRFEIDMVHEAVKTDLKGTMSFIVDQLAASPQIPGVGCYGIEATHSGMCRFESKNSPGYLNVSMRIKGWIGECPPVIRSRWVAEKKTRQQSKENAARELLGIFSDSGDAKMGDESMPNTPGKSAKLCISVSTGL